MATLAGDKPRPEVGQILVVIHDFSARSSDELSLAKGDRVELIERDDDFGDGWYLGRHLTNESNGLFPEVYTRLAPPAPPSFPLSTVSASKTYSANTPTPALVDLAAQTTSDSRISASTPTLGLNHTPQDDRLVSGSSKLETAGLDASLISPTTQVSESVRSPTMGAVGAMTSTAVFPKNLNLTSAVKSHAHGQDSPVMNETLSVIDEHIIDMKSPSNNGNGRNASTNDSGSEYSSNLDHRLSYINGEETDEEEEAVHTQEEVEHWTPDQVAECLFTAGVESKHCEVFRDQEITGDVLLGMDQASVFLKEFDLGSVGRRLKTWQKIKALQDEVNGTTRRNTQTFGSEGGVELGRTRSRSSITAGMLPRIPSLMDRPGSRQQSTRLSQQQGSRNNSMSTPVASKLGQESPTRPGVESRPSAASIRDLHHSRQNSVAQDFNGSSIIGALVADASTSQLANLQDKSHKKQPSFDRNWTMGSASPSISTRPSSSGGLKVLSPGSSDNLSRTPTPSTLDALDRGYFSGGEVEGRHRNVLRKKGSTSHSRNSSYTDEQRLRAATAQSRHSRFGSVDSMRETASSPASQKYYGLSANGRRRAPSVASAETPVRPMPPPKDIPSPVVTHVEAGESAKPSGSRVASDWLLPVKPLSQSRHFGLRAISDAVTGQEKSRLASPTDQISSPVKDSLDSPSRTGSSTPSGGPSLELDSPDAKSTSTMTTPGSLASKTSKKKTKKETSAYTRGLLKLSPKEQMADADYSGWMKKKSTNLMTTWKPRLFVLKGRRLSYYYSEEDEQEKGLIDISFHRVLPADTDRLTGLHATLTGATTSPTTPSGAHTQTSAEAAAAAEPESSLSKGSDQMFIFKLVPPRAGLSRAVTFTKPTVHYFAVPNVKQGRLWMAALMKATIDRDDSKPITTTYQQKTISLAKARQMRHRPPALMNLDEKVDEEELKTPASDRHGLNIQGVIYDGDPQEGDSGVSGILKPQESKPSLQQKPESAKAKTFSWDGAVAEGDVPLSA